MNRALNINVGQVLQSGKWNSVKTINGFDLIPVKVLIARSTKFMKT